MQIITKIFSSRDSREWINFLTNNYIDINLFYLIKISQPKMKNIPNQKEVK